MQPNATSYHFFLSEAGQWLQVIVFAGSIISRWRRWNQLKHITTGYVVLGQAVILVLLVALVLMMFGQTYLILIRVLIFSTLTAWEEYNTWYFSRLNVSVKELQAIRQPVLPNKPIYAPMKRLLRYLLDPPDAQPFWARHNFRNALLWLGAGLLCAYGFSRAINAYTAGLELVAKEQKKAAAQLARITAQNQRVAAMGQRGRDSIAAELRKKNWTDSIRYASTKADRVKYFKYLSDLKSDIQKTVSPKAAARPLIIVQPQAKTIPSSSFPLPGEERVRPLPTNTRPVKPRFKGKGQTSLPIPNEPYARADEWEEYEQK